MAFEKFLKKNLDLKIISLITAAFLWIFVHLTQSASAVGNPAVSLRVPLVVENLDPNLQVVESDGTVTITARGVHRTVESLKPSDFKAFVDLSGKGPGAFRNLPVQVASPVGAVVTEVNPVKAEVVVDQEEDKTVPVTWNFSGDQNIRKITVAPSNVVVKGPQTLVDRVAAAEIQIPEPEPLRAEQDEFSPRPVDVLSRPVPGPSVIPETVRIITQYPKSAKPLPVVPVIVGKIPAGMELKSVSVQPFVILADSQGRPPAVDHLDTRPVDVTDKQGTLVQTVKLQVPSGLNVYGKTQVQVTLVVGKRP